MATSPKVFLSHASKDVGVVQLLCAPIRDCGFDIFLDTHSLTGGEDFDRRILHEARVCSEQLVLLTPAALESQYVAYEIGLFRYQGKPTVYLLWGLTPQDVLAKKRVMGFVKTSHLLPLEHLDRYLTELRERARGGAS